MTASQAEALPAPHRKARRLGCLVDFLKNQSALPMRLHATRGHRGAPCRHWDKAHHERSPSCPAELSTGQTIRPAAFQHASGLRHPLPNHPPAHESVLFSQPHSRLQGQSCHPDLQSDPSHQRAAFLQGIWTTLLPGSAPLLTADWLQMPSASRCFSQRYAAQSHPNPPSARGHPEYAPSLLSFGPLHRAVAMQALAGHHPTSRAAAYPAMPCNWHVPQESRSRLHRLGDSHPHTLGRVQ